MKTITTHILILTSLMLTSCGNNTVKTDRANPLLLVDSTKDTLSFVVLQTLDTIITLSNLAKSNYNGQNLTDGIAKKTLYAYFKSKGCYNDDNLPEIDKLTDADFDKLSVSFNEIFEADLNGNKFKDAVITYWLTPPYANGHCWQPHKAIISDTDKGYKITNEEFIPDNFAIDSVLNKEGQVTIYGYDYDCGNHKVLKNIRVTIK